MLLAVDIEMPRLINLEYKRAAAAYAKYQKYGLKAAKGLLVTDWGDGGVNDKRINTIDFR
jgi:hypothetical protein